MSIHKLKKAELRERLTQAELAWNTWESRVQELESQVDQFRRWQGEICMKLGFPSWPYPEKDHARIIEALDHI